MVRVVRSTPVLALLLFLTPVSRPAYEAASGHGRITGHVRDQQGSPIHNAQVIVVGARLSALTDEAGAYTLAPVTPGTVTLHAAFVGYRVVNMTGARVTADSTTAADFAMEAAQIELAPVNVASGRPLVPRDEVTTKQRVDGSYTGVQTAVASSAFDQASVTTGASSAEFGNATAGVVNTSGHPVRHIKLDREQYSRIHENQFLRPSDSPLSTFSIDVDAASYSNVRRFIDAGQRPPRDAVQIEELVNYFPYAYPSPDGGTDTLFTVTTALAPCPWNPAHQLALIGLQGRRGTTADLPPNNLVALIDVSGSMYSPDKLPLVKRAFHLLVNQLRPEDRVAIVVYAGAAGLVLPSTAGTDKARILAALDGREAGGSTAGGEGIRLAYQVAAANFMPRGNNRVILATDGDFNVGVSSDAELIRMIEEKRTHGAFLTVLGFATGNLQDAKMERLADKGNGHYAYMDGVLEAQKVFVREMGATLLTIAKDVKLQVEFNPARVGAYRLIGYENRVLAAQDFNDDRKDAGELGAGHAVTALYEIVPPGTDRLRYQTVATSPRSYGRELMTVKLRYKQPDGETGRLIERRVTDRDLAGGALAGELHFAATVAAYGMILRESTFRGSATLDGVLALARDGVGADPDGYRADFVRMVERTRRMDVAARPE